MSHTELMLLLIKAQDARDAELTKYYVGQILLKHLSKPVIDSVPSPLDLAA